MKCHIKNLIGLHQRIFCHILDFSKMICIRLWLWLQRSPQLSYCNKIINKINYLIKMSTSTNSVGNSVSNAQACNKKKQWTMVMAILLCYESQLLWIFLNSEYFYWCIPSIYQAIYFGLPHSLLAFRIFWSSLHVWSLESEFRKLNEKQVKRGINIGNNNISNLRFADDIAIFENSLREVNIMSRESAKVRLFRNFAKNKSDDQQICYWQNKDKNSRNWNWESVSIPLPGSNDKAWWNSGYWDQEKDISLIAGF